MPHTAGYTGCDGGAGAMCWGARAGVTSDGRRRIGGFQRLKCTMKPGPDCDRCAKLNGLREQFLDQRTRLCAFL